MIFRTDIFRKLMLGTPDFLVTWVQKLGARLGPPGTARAQPCLQGGKRKTARHIILQKDRHLQKCHQGNRNDCQFFCLWTILKRCSFPETHETRREKIKNHETHTRVVIISMSVTISYKSLHICHHTTLVCAFVYKNVGKAYFKLIRMSFIWKPICNF